MGQIHGRFSARGQQNRVRMRKCAQIDVDFAVDLLQILFCNKLLAKSFLHVYFIQWACCRKPTVNPMRVSVHLLFSPSMGLDYAIT